MTESAFVFPCQGEQLLGILHSGSPEVRRGVLIVVGGPQYRVGSHRQFLLLARRLALAGYPALRFDYRGMGDASGEQVCFEAIDADIEAALNTFFARCPQLDEVVIWGLCDAASAALFYAGRDNRVGGLVLLNPWVRTEAGEAQAYLRHYYLRRVLDPNLWRNIVRGRFSFSASLSSLFSFWRQSQRRHEPQDILPLPERMALGLERFNGQVLLILSGNDLTAAEFKDTVAASPRWQQLLGRPRVERRELAAANHTFSTRHWRDQVADWTLDWLEEW